MDTDYAPFDEALKGTSGIMFSPETSNAPAKVIEEYRKKYKAAKKPIMKAASIDSSDLFLGHENLEMLSNLKSKEELIGEIIGLLQSPAKKRYWCATEWRQHYRRIGQDPFRKKRNMKYEM